LPAATKHYSLPAAVQCAAVEASAVDLRSSIHARLDSFFA
jgi:hypothetical protein